MNKKFSFTIIIIICFFLTGCWNSREIDKLAIARGIGIDKNKNGYRITMQILNSSKLKAKQKSQEASVITFREDGQDIFESIRRMTRISPRRVYLAHIGVVIIGEELAREGISQILDFLARDHEFRTDYYILIAKNTTAEEVLNVLTPLEEIPANKIYSALETSEKAWAPSKGIRILSLINSIVADGKETVLSGVQILGNKEDGNNTKGLSKPNADTLLQITPFSVFKKDKLVGWLNENESKGLNYILGDVKNSVGFVSLGQDKRIGLEILSAKSEIKANFENNKPKIEIKIKVESNISEVQFNFDDSKKENIDKVAKLSVEKVKSFCEAVIQKAQEDFNSDIFGFGEVIRRANHKLWKNLKDNWQEEFKNLSVEVDVDCHIIHSGTLNKSYFVKE
jgi:spore germination protein KC